MFSIAGIRSKLQNSIPQKIIDSELQRGAVLIPIFENNNEFFILFTKRTEVLPTHKGQISFPGGKLDSKDNSLYECATRELEEEIGIPTDQVELLGELNEIRTNSSNILLSAFVGKINYPFKLTINRDEVEEIIEVPLLELFNESLWENAIIKLDGEEIKVWFFNFGQHVIWGATALITRNLIEVLKKN